MQCRREGEREREREIEHESVKKQAYTGQAGTNKRFITVTPEGPKQLINNREWVRTEESEAESTLQQDGINRMRLGGAESRIECAYC